MQELNQSFYLQQAHLLSRQAANSILAKAISSIGNCCLKKNITPSSMDIHVLRHSLDAVNDIVKKNINAVNKEIL